MKVILKKDVPKLGRAYDILEVNEGYANNFLFPNSLAIKATDDLIFDVQRKKAEKDGQKKVAHNLLEKTILELNGKEFLIKKPTNDKGTLFSKIHQKDICEVLETEKGIKFKENMIILEKPIDRVGEYDISIFSEGVYGNFKLKVEGE